MEFDAIVIGAGPAGATAAQLLAAGGRQVALVEKDTFPRRKVCGEFLSAPSHAVLDLCGVGAAFRAQAGPVVRRIGLFSGDTIVIAPQEKDWGQALGREHLDTMLRDAAMAAGAHLFQPAELVTLQRRGADYHCRLKIGDGENTIAAPIIIAAAGSWRTKPPLAVLRPECPSDLLAFKAHFCGGAPAPGLMPLLAFAGGYGGLVQSDGGRLSLSCCIRRDALAAARRPGERAGDAVLRHIKDSTHGVAAALDGAVLQENVLAAGPIRPGIRPRFAGGIFFTGNLAGEAHPVIAEGISMAIQGAHLLGRLLLAQGPGAAAAYEAGWLRAFGPRLVAASLFARAALGARRPATTLVKAVPALLTWGAALSGKGMA
ncbi:MAG: FAD-dependent monooxygenase [Alphaproteobacteria bacterium]|nr:FAD-dependent monooxygenase [Alphaproteobacteria bacterium]